MEPAATKEHSDFCPDVKKSPGLPEAKTHPPGQLASGYRIYRQEDQDVEAAEDADNQPDLLAPPMDWSLLGPSEHFVQFYEDHDNLARSAGNFLAGSLRKGKGAVVIATKPHRDAIADVLQAQGIDLTASAHRGQFIALDATETLAKFMVDGMPDARRFRDTIGATVARMSEDVGGLRAFGEMVALLWEEGKHEAAIRLEEMWNELAKAYTFALFCAYPIHAFVENNGNESLEHVCQSHSRVIPMESYAALKQRDERMRAIALLQQKSVALEAEIIHRKEIEESLRRRDREYRQAEEAKALLAAVVESSEDAIISKTLTGRILSWNKAAERLFGYSAQEAIGQPITMLIPTERLDEEHMIISRLRRGERIEHYETVRKTKDGRLIHISLSISPLRDAGGTVVGASKIARDITVQKQLQTALRRAEERYRDHTARQIKGLTRLNELAAKLAHMHNPRDMLEAILNTIAALHHTDRGVLSLYNPATRSLEVGAKLGFGQEAVDCLNGIKPGMGATGAAYEHRQRVVVEDTETDPLFAPLRDVARKFGFRAVHSTPVITRSGECIGVLSVHFAEPYRPSELEIQLTEMCVRQAADFIERSKAEVALKEADRRKDEFLATLAHELRNPLAPIRNAIHVLELSKASDRIKEEALNLMKRQVLQMTRLIDDLMDVSRVSQGKIELRRNPVSLTEVIDAAVETARPLIAEKGHELIIHQPDQPVWVQADTVRLSQVFANLLNNAAKYTDDGGKIELTVRREGSEALITITDNGIGIPEKMLPAIFDLFVQVDNSLERTHGGLGIGLTLVKELVERHGGRVRADSPGVGKGSTFSVRLPLAQKKAGETENADAADPVRSYRVLVVDDSEASAKTLGWTLELLGHEVALAQDERSAMEAARRFRPEVILLDIGLPGTNGYELCEIMRQTPETKDAFIIAQTGWGQEEHRRRSEAAGFNHHLVKPIDMDTLKNLLGSLER